MRLLGHRGRGRYRNRGRISVGFIDTDTDTDPDADGPISKMRIAAVSSIRLTCVRTSGMLRAMTSLLRIVRGR